jgi:predicted DCC family thiol-disulfide oxidoreductase YuxK
MEGGLQIAYDGDCPFCTAYVRILRLRESVGSVRLVSARSQDPFIHELRQKGFDLDQGFVAKMGGRYYYGADCLNFLSLLSSPYGFWNRLMALLFRHPRFANVMYPVLRASRNAALFLAGRERIHQNLN